MCNSIFIGCFCVVFHCNTYELYRLFSIQIVIHIGLTSITVLACHVFTNVFLGMQMPCLFKRINKCCFQTLVNKHLYRPKKLEYKMAQWFLYSLHKYHNGDLFLQTVVILAKLLYSGLFQGM